MLAALSGFGTYIWFRCRNVILGNAALVLIAVLAVALNPQLPVVWLAIFCFFCLFAVLALQVSLAISDRVDLGISAFPKPLLLLPLSDAELAWSPMLVGMAIMAVLGWAFGRGVFVPTSGPTHLWWPAAYLAGSLASIQAISWTTFRQPVVRVLVGLIPAAAMALGPILVSLKLPTTSVAIGYLLLIPAAMLWAFLGIRAARRGVTTTGFRIWTPTRDLPAFPTPIAAQIWLESKRNGMITRVLAAVTLGLVVILSATTVYASPATLVVGDQLVSLPTMALAAFALVMGPFVVAMGGCCASVTDNLTKGSETLVPFLALRPLSTAQLIEAKLRMGLRLYLSILPAVFGVALFVLLIPVDVAGRHQPTLLAFTHAGTLRYATLFFLTYATVLLIGARSMVSSIWLGIGRLHEAVRMVISVGIPFALFGSGAFINAYWSEIGPTVLKLLPVATAVILVAKFGVAIWSSQASIRMGLIERTMVIRWCGVWFLVGLVLFAAWVPYAKDYGITPAMVAAQALLVIPLARIALTPLLVDRNRHR